MSMIGNLARVSVTKCNSLHSDPVSITSFLYPNRSGSSANAKGGFFSRLFGSAKENAEPVAVESLLQTDSLDLDKAWHALHFLFTGSNWEGPFPEGFLVSAGEPVGDVDVGYGPARSFTPEEVEKIALFLTNIDEAKLRGRLDPIKMAELDIYPSVWSSETKLDDEWAYMNDALQRMRMFVREAASKRMALLVYIN
jgi:hypothetical protein